MAIFVTTLKLYDLPEDGSVRAVEGSLSLDTRNASTNRNPVRAEAVATVQALPIMHKSLKRPDDELDGEVIEWLDESDRTGWSDFFLRMGLTDIWALKTLAAGACFISPSG